MIMNETERLQMARVQARKEFAELARLYSSRQKSDPAMRIAFSELQMELEESVDRVENADGKEAA